MKARRSPRLEQFDHQRVADRSSRARAPGVIRRGRAALMRSAFWARTVGTAPRRGSPHGRRNGDRKPGGGMIHECHVQRCSGRRAPVRRRRSAAHCPHPSPPGVRPGFGFPPPRPPVQRQLRCQTGGWHGPRLVNGTFALRVCLPWSGFWLRQTRPRSGWVQGARKSASAALPSPPVRPGRRPVTAGVRMEVGRQRAGHACGLRPTRRSGRRTRQSCPCRCPWPGNGQRRPPAATLADR